MKKNFAKIESLIVLGFYLGLFLVGGLAAVLHIDLMGLLDALPQVCLFRRLTDLKCPGCGLTHAFLAMGQFHFREAFTYHPFSPLLFFGGMAWLFIERRERLVPKGFGLGALIVTLCIFWVVRNLG